MSDKKSPLTAEQKEKIYRAIADRQNPDDRFPPEIIADDYRGDEDAYLRDMAWWHDIPLE